MEATTARLEEAEETVGELEDKLWKKRKLRKRDKKKSRSTRKELEN